MKFAYNQSNLNQLETLTHLNLDDLIASFGWKPRSLEARLFRRLLLEPARHFASRIVGFDRAIGQLGLPEASRALQRSFVKDIRVHGLEQVPPGPILILSNHPGMTDTISIFAALGRADLKIVALQRPFLLAMPNMSRHLLFVVDDASARMNLVRNANLHLRACGAVLTFPAGHIEPDPDIDAGAIDSLESWNASVGLFIRSVPEAVILPILVRGVVWSKAAHSPLLLFKRTKEEKGRLAAALQLMTTVVFYLRPVTIHIQIGQPIIPANSVGASAKAIHQAVLAEMRSLILHPPEGPGVSVI